LISHTASTEVALAVNRPAPFLVRSGIQAGDLLKAPRGHPQLAPLPRQQLRDSADFHDHDGAVQQTVQEKVIGVDAGGGIAPLFTDLNSTPNSTSTILSCRDINT
jgi:hypothetical protein